MLPGKAGPEKLQPSIFRGDPKETRQAAETERGAVEVRWNLLSTLSRANIYVGLYFFTLKVQTISSISMNSRLCTVKLLSHMHSV